MIRSELSREPPGWLGLEQLSWELGWRRGGFGGDLAALPVYMGRLLGGQSHGLHRGLGQERAILVIN